MIGEVIDHRSDPEQLRGPRRRGRYAKTPDGGEHWVSIERHPDHYATEVYRYSSIKKNGERRKNARPWVAGREYRGFEQVEDWFHRTVRAIEAGEYTSGQGA